MSKKKVKNTKQQFTEKEEKTVLFKVKPVSFKNDRQHDLFDKIMHNQVTIADGEAGTGKTFVALYTALKLLQTPNNNFNKIVLVKSVTTLPGEEIGFLQGSMKEKMQPYMVSFTSNIEKLIGQSTSTRLFKDNQIEILPIAFIRGMSIDNSIVIIDEVQNITDHMFKSLITRIGENSKYILMGDREQIDRNNGSCLSNIMKIFEDNSIIKTVQFEAGDSVRNEIIPKILNKLKLYKNTKEKENPVNCNYLFKDVPSVHIDKSYSIFKRTPFKTIF